MRCACSAMMPRKRAWAGGSSAAGPRSVSMKPIRLVSGVRSSWLALATKSARIRSTIRSRVRSESTRTKRPPSASGGSSGMMVARISRAIGMAMLSSADCTVSWACARSSAPRSPG